VAEALRHAGYALDAVVDIQWTASETLREENVNENTTFEPHTWIDHNTLQSGKRIHYL